MGVAATQFRLLISKGQLSDYQFQAQMVNQSKQQLGASSGNLWSLTANLDPNSPTMQVLNAQIAVIQQIEKGLEQQSTRLDLLVKAITTEVEGLNKVLDKNISNTFKLLA
ncbi:MAG: hypothetical protein NTW61_01900 [Candidatus Melainabacteria bacterium]|nr:hypothetical protein [Candidatus Melainabacteria bacterium]